MKNRSKFMCTMLLAGALVAPTFTAFAEEAVKTPTQFYTLTAEAKEATTVTVEEGVVLTVGDKVDLGVLVGENNESVRFTSSDAKVATVDAMGTPRAYNKSITKLTAVAVGETTITIYTAEGQTMQCKVTVKAEGEEVAPEVTTPEAVETTPAAVETVSAVKIVPAVEAEVTTEEAVATTTSSAVTTETVEKTPTQFYTKAVDATEEVTVTVEDGVVLTPGGKVNLGVLVGENNESVRFVSSDAKVVTVENMGTPYNYGKSVAKLTAVAEGEAKITIYTTEGTTMTCKVVVKAAEAK